MRKIYFFVWIFLAAVSSGWSQQFEFAGGDGTSGDPYQVETAEHLNNVRNQLHAYFIQTENIDLSDFNNWEPIGNEENKFRGHYDGGGKTISNLTIDRPGQDYVGLFGHFGVSSENTFEDHANIKRVVLNDVNIIGKFYVGSLVGKVTGGPNTIIENNYVINGDVKGNSFTGGLVGANNSGSGGENTILRPVIRTSSANVTVEFVEISAGENRRIGGLVGCNQRGDIINSYSASIVKVNTNSSVQAVGGLVGSMTNSGKVENSYSSGQMDLSATVTSFGGLIGNRAGNNSVNSSYWDIETSGLTNSAGGLGRNTAQMQKKATFSGWSFSEPETTETPEIPGIWKILEDESYPFLSGTDKLSGFYVTGPSTTVAGESFNLQISNASDVNGGILNGYFQVTITSDIAGEANGGPVFNNVVQFISGATTIANLQLFIADDLQLSISIQGIAEAKIHPITVTPALAKKLLITQQPASEISGTFGNEPAELGTIVVISADAYNNISTNGLAEGQLVSVDIQSVESGGVGAVLGGDAPIDLFLNDGIATFENLTIDKEGTNYILRFSSPVNVELDYADTDPFSVTNIDDASGFEIFVESETQYLNQEFELSFTDARNVEGNLLDGNLNVTIQSSIPEESNSFNGNLLFSGGEASITITLEEPGLHTLTVSIATITESETIVITVKEDESGFTLEPPGDQFANIPFLLNIQDARDKDGDFITEALVTIESDEDGVVFSGLVSGFDTNGNVDIEITLTTVTDPNDHTLTVTIEGITDPETTTVNVKENVSGFDVVLADVSEKTAGTSFDLSISNATNSTTLPVDFTGNYTVQVESDPEGVVLGPTSVAFVEGAATVPVTLTIAGTHQLTVSVSTITNPETVADVIVNPTTAVNLVLTSGDVEDVTGNFDGAQVTIGSITLQTQDQFGNLSTVGLSDPQDVTVELHPDSDHLDALGGNLNFDTSVNGEFTFSGLTIDQDGFYKLLFKTTLDAEEKGAETNLFEVSGINDLSGFDIVNPGPQIMNLPFLLFFENIINSQSVELNGFFDIHVKAIPGGFQQFASDFTFTSHEISQGSTSVTLVLQFDIEYELIVTIETINSSENIFLSIVPNDLSNISFALALDPNQNPTAGEPFNLNITDAKDKAGNDLTGQRFVTLTTNNVEEGVGGVLFSGYLNFPDGEAENGEGEAEIVGLELFKAEEQTLTLAIDWVTNPVNLPVTVDPNTATQLVFVQQPTGNTGAGDDIPTLVGTSDVVFTFFDAYGNPSTVGLEPAEGELDITMSVALTTDGSLGEAATLAGTPTQTLNTETASFVFPDLTLDKDGTGYVLTFTYEGTSPFDPIVPVVSQTFDMLSVNSYGIALENELEQAITSLVDFGDKPFGYDPVADTIITIKRVGMGDIISLSVSLDEVVANSFEINQPLLTVLVNETDNTTFSLKPAHGLAAGLYEATVTVTANAGLDSEQLVQFEVRFRVVADYAISLDADDPLVIPSVSETYDPEDRLQTITITNTGANELTGLKVELGGDNPAAFVITPPTPDALVANAQATFTLKPAIDLPAGTYSALVTVSNTPGEESEEQLIEQSFTVQFDVLDEVRWTGAVSSSWSNPDNWNPDIIPGENDIIRIPGGLATYPEIINFSVTISDLTIASGAQLTVRSTQTLNIRENGVLTIQPGGKLTATGQLNNFAGVEGLLLQSDASGTASVIVNNPGVEATVERWLKGDNNFHTVSVPVIGQTLEDFIADNPIMYNVSHGIYAITHYEPNVGWSSWYAPGITGPMSQSRTYIMSVNNTGGNSKVRFKGALRSADLSVEIFRGETGFGWNGIGNPFTAPIRITSDTEIASFLDENAGALDVNYAALYVYDYSLPAGSLRYRIINNVPNDGYDQDYLGVGQGFIVKSKSGNYTVNLNTTSRSHQSTDFFKSIPVSGEWSRVRLQVSDGHKTTSTLLAFHPQMTKGLDVTYDAGVLGADGGFNLFTRMADGQSDINLGIQALPDTNMEELLIPVGFAYNRSGGGEVTFSLNNMQLPAGTRPVLEDKSTGVFTDLSQNDYTVFLPANAPATGRFYLHMEKSGGTHPFHYTIAQGEGEILATLNGAPLASGTPVEAGESIALTALPYEDYVFTGWSMEGETLSQEMHYDFLMPEHEATLAATFRLLGDLNNDGVVNVADLSMLLNHIIGIEQDDFCEIVADVNGDGKVNILDVVVLINMILGEDKTLKADFTSQAAYIALMDNLISLESDGSLSALQFELYGASGVILELLDDNHQMVYHNEGNRIRGVVFSTENYPLPEGIMDIISVYAHEQNLEWGQLSAANIYGQAVEVLVKTITTVPDIALEGTEVLIYPNPAPGWFFTQMNLREATLLEMELFDVSGRSVLLLSEKLYGEGYHTLRLEPRDVMPGVYFLQLKGRMPGTDSYLFNREVRILMQ